jgi:hypothetical protein
LDSSSLSGLESFFVPVSRGPNSARLGQPLLRRRYL